MQRVIVKLINNETIEGNADIGGMGLPDEVGVFTESGMYVVPAESILTIFVPTQEMPSA